MAGFAERRAEEAAFLDDPEAAVGARGMAAIHQVGQALDLGYCGVDFSILPDGCLLIFEANATMLAHTEDPAGPFASPRRTHRLGLPGVHGPAGGI
jgi:hypothetical protein